MLRLAVPPRSHDIRQSCTMFGRNSNDEIHSCQHDTAAPCSSALITSCTSLWCSSVPATVRQASSLPASAREPLSEGSVQHAKQLGGACNRVSLPYYMASEQCSNAEDVGPAADIWRARRARSPQTAGRSSHRRQGRAGLGRAALQAEIPGPPRLCLVQDREMVDNLGLRRQGSGLPHAP